jgi:hypothetical protein
MTAGSRLAACARPVALVAFVALVAGCVSVRRDEYPPYWPALQPAQAGCPGLTGSFDNRDLDESRPTLLAKWLLQTADPLKQVHRVELAGPEAGALSVRFVDGNGEELLGRDLRDGEHFACRDGWLELRQPEVVFVGIVNRRIARFARNVRGDLVVQESDVGGGVVLVVPMYVSERNWHLYRERSR